MEIIKFRPLLKQVLWGGNKIIPFKQLDQHLEQVGESWEISGLKGNESIVADGLYKGMQLNDLVSRLKDKLMGKDNYERFGNEFPLLIKFIDAHAQLSIQVHPNDDQARAKGLDRGKTEMWYVMKSDEGARLMSGFRKALTPEEYQEKVENDTITDALAEYEVKEGDVFYLPAGRIHSIGTGCFLAEIQQTSNTTYRIYDFKRRDKDGNYRELHTKEAADCIDFSVESDYRIQYAPRRNEGVQLVACPYFTTSVYDLTEPMVLDYSELDSFVILMGLSGMGTITDDEGNESPFQAGETILLPATATSVKVEGEIKFLEVYV